MLTLSITELLPNKEATQTVKKSGMERAKRITIYREEKHQYEVLLYYLHRKQAFFSFSRQDLEGDY